MSTKRASAPRRVTKKTSKARAHNPRARRSSEDGDEERGERSIWRGQISFGLVNIPVSLATAERRNDLQFHLLDRRDHARVHYQRLNEKTGKEVPWSEVIKGYEIHRGHYVLLEDEDFKAAAVEATQTIDIEAFTERASIEVAYYEQPYFLLPEKRGEKGYVLLRESLRRADKVAVARVVIRTRQHLAVVMPEGEVLLLVLLRFAEELRDPEDLKLPSRDLKASKITSRELDMADQLISSMTEKWKPSQYRDEYRAALLSFIRKKSRGRGAPAATDEREKEEAPRGKVLDLSDLLARSLKKKSTSRSSARSAPSAKRASHGR